MNRTSFQILAVSTALTLLATGCATTRARKPDAAQDPQHQIADLQSQLVAKDQEIADLRYQLDSRQTMPDTNFSSGNSDKHNILRVSGVSATEVQRALLRAGYDPGPIDGRLGKKTKSAIKQFQRSKGLTADGVVGERTWSALRAY
jgi:murein L,D-transpeptidase YcbB/YkuD